MWSVRSWAAFSRPGSASDATQALEAIQTTHDGADGLKGATSNATSPTEVVAQDTAAAAAAAEAAAAATAAAATANDAGAADHGAVTEVVADAEDSAVAAAASAAAAALAPFRSIQGMGPAMLTSLLRFARADTGNRPVVDTLASEVRFAAAPAERRRRSPMAGGQGTAGAWVEGKTVVFTGSLTRHVLYFVVVSAVAGVRRPGYRQRNGNRSRLVFRVFTGS